MQSRRPLVLIADDRFPNHNIEQTILASCGVDVSLCSTWPDPRLGEADALLVNLFPVDREIITSMQRCRVISRYGVGCDNVDVAAAMEQGIVVCNVPDYCSEECAEHALALLLACSRRIVARDRAIRGGAWGGAPAANMRSLQGSVLGVIGFGKVARALISKCCSLGFARILVNAPPRNRDAIRHAGLEPVPLQRLLTESDCITLHAPLTTATRHLLDREAFAAMQRQPILINTARGDLVDEAALVAALQGGQVAAAGLDVFAVEPLSGDSPLRILDNVVLTDHVAYLGEAALRRLQQQAAENVAAVLRGEEPIHPVRPG